MKLSTARATSKPTVTRATTSSVTERGKAASPSRTRASPARTPARTAGSPARNRVSKTSPAMEPPRRSTSSSAAAAAPIRQSATPTRIPTYSGRASVSRGVSPPLSSSLEANSPVKSKNAATRIPSVKGSSPARNSNIEPKSKQILSHEFLSKTTSAKSSRGQSPLNRSIDEPSRRPSNKLQDYMSKSHDHGSLSNGSKFLSKSQNQGPKSLSTSQDRGFMSKSQDRGFMTKSQDTGFMSKSQDRGFMSKSQDRGSYANQNAAPRKVTVPEYGYDGRRKSTSSRDAAATTYSGGLNRNIPLHLLMGRSVDSTVSLSTAASSPIRGGRQSFLVPLQLSDPIMSQGYRSGELTPEDASPLDGRAPARKHRQLKSPDFFDVKKLDGDGGVITAVSRMHHSKPLVQRTETEEDQEQASSTRPNKPHHYEQRRDTLADSARKAFSVETDSAIGSSHFSSEINYKLEKALNGAQDLLEIGSWNDDDEEYLRIYKHERGTSSFVDIMENKAASNDSVNDAVNTVSNHTVNESPSRSKKWPEVCHLSQYDNALYQKSEPDSDFVTSTQASPQASPPRISPTTAATQPANNAVISRISSTSATSIDLNRSTDTTCSTYSQYDNAFWADPPINGTFRPWNPKREAEMMPPTAAVVPTLPMAELQAHPPPEPCPIPVATVLNETRMLRYNDGLERLTSYMKTASQSARKNKRGLGSEDDLSSSQASGCFDYLVDFLETQTSITDVLVSAHDETLKLNDFAHSAAGGAALMNSSPAVKRLDSKMTNDTAMLSNRSIESRITDLGSEASWESGKSRSVQTLGSSTGKVMDQITEKVDSLSFDSPKHLSTFKFGLKKTTMGACETITSSDQQAIMLAKLPLDQQASQATQFFPQRKSVSIPVREHPPPMSPGSNLSWPSQTAPSSINPSRNPSRTPSQRAFSDEKLGGIAHRLPSPLSTSLRQIKIVSEAGVESQREDEVSPSSSDNPPVAEMSFPSPEKPSPSSENKDNTSEKAVAAAAVGSTSPTVEAPSKNVQMQHSSNAATPEIPHRAGIGKQRQIDRDNLSLRLDQANKGCGCTIL